MIKKIEVIVGVVLGAMAIILSVITNAGLACIVASSLLTLAFVIAVVLEYTRAKEAQENYACCDEACDCVCEPPVVVAVQKPRTVVKSAEKKPAAKKKTSK